MESLPLALRLASVYSDRHIPAVSLDLAKLSQVQSRGRLSSWRVGQAWQLQYARGALGWQ